MRPHGMNHATRRTWRKIIEGVRTARSATDSYEIIEELSISTYYRHLWSANSYSTHDRRNLEFAPHTSLGENLDRPVSVR